MKTKAQSIIENKVRRLVKRKLAERLMMGFGFDKKDAFRLNLLRANEASINKDNDFDAPLKANKSGKDKSAPSTEPPVQKDLGTDVGLDSPKEKNGDMSDMGMDEPGLDKSGKPKEEKSKSKDWDEISNEVFLYIKQASGMIGDSDGTQREKILKKLIDTVNAKFSEVPEDIEGGLNEKKKTKKKKKIV